VVFMNLGEFAVPEPLGAAGAGSGLGLLVTGGYDTLIGLAGGRPVWTRALARLEVDRMNAGTGAAGYAPDPGSYAGDLLEVLLCEGDASLETG
jgi:hypothetical protein